MATRPPAWPTSILRGHASQVHSVQFVCQNTRLLTGDADGWVVFWKVENKRPLAVWKAHEGPILGLAEWGPTRYITHGRDNALRVWRLDESFQRYSITLPAEPGEEYRTIPCLLHSLPVNTLNFCSFSMCYQHAQQRAQADRKGKANMSTTSVLSRDSILVAVPATDDKFVDVYQLPGESLKARTPRVQSVVTGMVMAVKLVRHQASQIILLLVGYEAGITAVFKLPRNCTGLAMETAQLMYLSNPHSQPVLSLDVSPEGDFYFTSSADAIVAMHHIPQPPPDHDEAYGSSEAPVFPFGPLVTLQAPHKTLDTKHAGQQSLRVRSDGRLLITGGWDTRIRIYSTRTLKEVAMLKWHKEGVYAVDFSTILTAEDVEVNEDEKTRFGKACQEINRRLANKEEELPSYVLRTLEILNQKLSEDEEAFKIMLRQAEEAYAFRVFMDRMGGRSRLLEAPDRQREEKTMVKHWVAAGAKDGKVSLWEVF
ncbi:WD40 repeat-like protein [Decorospora gaudefroyi]|uniref:ASTRA-associated protein 1 n=1 Tax=Decorospora gaudefroyi TaxID=184978 RepID=A0A6A5KLK8_9PLEO|nr:WD40 repeat-like protein [Decorospora gaudefroyi]